MIEILDDDRGWCLLEDIAGEVPPEPTVYRVECVVPYVNGPKSAVYFLVGIETFNEFMTDRQEIAEYVLTVRPTTIDEVRKELADKEGC